MSKKEMTLVYYYVPEDKDDPDCPNVFGVPQSKANLRLSHIYDAFPLKGSYLFRFKYDNEGTAVWLDLPNVQQKLPLYRNQVIIKATRVSWQESKLHSQYRDRAELKGDMNKKQQKVDFFDSHPQAQQSPVPKPTSTLNGHSGVQSNQGKGMNLLDDHQEVKPKADLMGHGDLI